jgi:hypothetical protein
VNVALAALLGLAASAVARAAAQTSGFLAPAGGERFAAGSVVTVRWALPARTAERDEAELVLSLDGGMTFPIRLTARMPRDGSAVRWRVPALATTKGRLALRVGEEGRPETERIEAVSEPFSLVADGAAGEGELVRGATEWWTRQALSDIGAEDLLSESLHGQPDRIVRVEEHPEISESSSPVLPSPGLSHDDAFAGEAVLGATLGAAPSMRRPAPVPMRE